MATPPSAHLQELAGEAAEDDVHQTGLHGGNAAAAAADSDEFREEDEEVISSSDEDDDDEDDDFEDEEEDDDDDGEVIKLSTVRAKFDALSRRLESNPVSLRVHDIIIKGNVKTKDDVIETEVSGPLRSATTMQELLASAAEVQARLDHLNIFDSVEITFEAGPRELHGTTNVVIEVSEVKNPLTGEVGIFTRPEAKSTTLEGSLKLKNPFGYGDIWDASLARGWDHTTVTSAGLLLPRFKMLPFPMTARVSLLSKDWLKFSSYKENLLGFSFSFPLLENHELSYNLAWRHLNDPTRGASKAIRSLLGHSLLSSIKHTYKIDMRDSPLRPTRGCAFVTTNELGFGLDKRSVQFLRTEMDLRMAVPLGFFNSAFNAGISAGCLFPFRSWSLSSTLPERFHMGGHFSPICMMGGPTSLLGFKTRGIGPTDARRLVPNRNNEDTSDASPERDALGGDFAVSCFLDLSFDLPLRLFRKMGVYGHAFLCSGNVTKLSGNEFRNVTLQSFLETLRWSAGFGMVIPSKLFRMEVNYLYILKQSEHDKGKTGIQLSFSSPL